MAVLERVPRRAKGVSLSLSVSSPNAKWLWALGRGGMRGLLGLAVLTPILARKSSASLAILAVPSGVGGRDFSTSSSSSSDRSLCGTSSGRSIIEDSSSSTCTTNFLLFFAPLTLLPTGAFPFSLLVVPWAGAFPFPFLVVLVVPWAGAFPFPFLVVGLTSTSAVRSTTSPASGF